MTYLDSDFDYDLFFHPTCAFYSIFNQVQAKKDGSLIHIATAGGRIPSYVYTNIFNHTTRYELKNSQEELGGQVRINPNLESILGLSLDKNLDTDIGTAMDLYTHDFTEYAKRNCFSFDRTHISHPLTNHYHLVAAPPDENPENKIPSNNYPYRFSFLQCNQLVFLILRNLKKFSPNISNIRCQTDCDRFHMCDPHIIGYSPFRFNSNELPGVEL